MARMPIDLSDSTCANHPDRRGTGICVACGKVICTECLTRVDGIIHCRDCLRARFDPKRRRRASLGVQFLAMLAVIAGFFLAMWFFGSLGRIAASFPDDVSISIFGAEEKSP